ncbi:hypothetical protein Tco_0344792 [Tanacetum coccineum]
MYKGVFVIRVSAKKNGLIDISDSASVSCYRDGLIISVLQSVSVIDNVKQVLPALTASNMKVAYRPSGNFSLRDFHHAVNNLPADAFMPEFNNGIAVSCCDVHLSSVLSDKVLYSWGDNEDVGRKVIVISSCLLEDIDSATKIALMDAADKCVSVDFVLLEKVSSGRGALSERIDNFNRNICDLENCSFRDHLSDAKVLCALVREWLKDLRDEAEQLQARLKFKRNILGSLNQICCNLFSSFNRIIDEFEPCQVCRCHGDQLDDERGNKLVKSTSCPVTGLIMGTLIVVVPYTSNELDDTDHAESLPAKSEELPPEPTSTQGDSLNESETSKQAMGMIGSEEEIPQLDFKSGRDKITERITEEWEQLIVNEIPKISHLNCVSKPKLDHLAFTPIESSKPLDEKTSRILERLEIPRKGRNLN